jgi:hypothetical protein
VSTAAGGDVYEQHNKEERVLSSDNEEVVKSTCAASQLCRDPNNDTDNYLLSPPFAGVFSPL